MQTWTENARVLKLMALWRPPLHASFHRYVTKNDFVWSSVTTGCLLGRSAALMEHNILLKASYLIVSDVVLYVQTTLSQTSKTSLNSSVSSV